jgi:2-iminobutanoate/2-iminopropanoate deaminase
VPVFSFSQTKFVTAKTENKNKHTNTMEKKIITSPDAPAPIGPYSHGVLAGNTFYVSGQVPKDARTGEMVQGDIKAETKKVMENIQAILTEAGMDFSNVVKTTIFCVDLGNFGAINEMYGSFFTGNYPARETVQVSKLPLNANVEISVVAVK